MPRPPPRRGATRRLTEQKRWQTCWSWCGHIRSPCLATSAPHVGAGRGGVRRGGAGRAQWAEWRGIGGREAYMRACVCWEGSDRKHASRFAVAATAPCWPVRSNNLDPHHSTLQGKRCPALPSQAHQQQRRDAASAGRSAPRRLQLTAGILLLHSRSAGQAAVDPHHAFLRCLLLRLLLRLLRLLCAVPCVPLCLPCPCCRGQADGRCCQGRPSGPADRGAEAG